jgi:rhodanese-related sulfurtransferase
MSADSDRIEPSLIETRRSPFVALRGSTSSRLVLAASIAFAISIVSTNAAIGEGSNETTSAPPVAAPSTSPSASPSPPRSLSPSPSASASPSPASGPVSAPPAAERIDRSLLLSYLVDKTAFTLIDARSPEEYAVGHVDGAVNLPIDQIGTDSEKLPSNLEEPILVYCKSGFRAKAVAEALTDRGYASVRVLPSEQLLFHDDLIVFNCGQ